MPWNDITGNNDNSSITNMINIAFFQSPMDIIHEIVHAGSIALSDVVPLPTVGPIVMSCIVYRNFF
jgi:hypothetical protein